MNVYLYSSKTSKYFKTIPQFSYLFNQNAFIDMVRRSCSQTAYVICFSAKNNGLIFHSLCLPKQTTKHQDTYHISNQREFSLECH